MIASVKSAAPTPNAFRPLAIDAEAVMEDRKENDLFVPSRYQPREDDVAPIRTMVSRTTGRVADLPGFDSPVDHGVFPEFLDKTADPASDFYGYAAGTWVKDKAAKATPDGTYIDLARRSSAAQRDILEKSVSAPQNPNQKMLGDFYASGLNVAAADSKGLEPVAALFSSIDGLTGLDQVPGLLGRLHKTGISGLGFKFIAQPDAATHRYVAFVGGPTPRLTSADLQDTDAAKAHLKAYRQHIAKVFELGGDSPEASGLKADQVIAIETRLVRANEKSGKPELMSVDQLMQTTPGFNWKNYLQELGRPDITSLGVEGKTGLQELQSLSVDDWKTYLRWNTLDSLTYVLPTPFGQEDAAFKGVKAPDRKRSLLGLTNDYLGMPLGIEFAHRYFSEEEKAKGTEIVNNVRQSIGEMISASTWLEPSTKENAIKKLDNMKLMLGAPDQIDPVYSQLSFDRENFLGNILELYQMRFQSSLESVGKELPRDRWIHTPQTANAAYSRTGNCFTITSLYFEHPTFFMNDDAANYGVVGAVAGHEMSHGFDNNGSKFDWEGKQHDWWDAGDRAEFEQIVSRVVKDADAHEVLPGLFLRGKAVVGESMADLMGVRAAYRAFKKSQEGKPQEIIDGFTPDQRFFLSYAQFRKQWVPDDSLRKQIETDPHPDSQFRVNETFFNNPEFYSAFSLAPKPDLIQVW